MKGALWWLDLAFACVFNGLAARSGAALILALSGTPSSAQQGIFDFLFGGFKRLAAPAPTSYADPNHASGGHDGAAVARLRRRRSVFLRADVRRAVFPDRQSRRRKRGRALPLVLSACSDANLLRLEDRSFGRARRPALFEIPNAFVYREKMVADCSCDGKSATGLVRLDPRDDPTLRPGDFVATGQGLMAYRGGTAPPRNSPRSPTCRAFRRTCASN